MKLIWTYNGKANVGKVTNDRRVTLINYYILSILSAKKLGYYCIIYTNKEEITYFEDIVNEIVELNEYEGSILTDSFKIKVLEERNDDFCLIDGDVILKDKLPEFNNGIMFDTYEIGNWKGEYEETVNKLTKLGISETIPFWIGSRVNVINCGLLRITNKNDRNIYVTFWKKYNNWLKDKFENNDINLYSATMIGAQYLLTLIVEFYEINPLCLNKNMGETGKYYTHHFGEIKFQTPIVPTDKMIKIREIKNLI